MVGGVVSRTEMLCKQLAVFPQPSVAVQVRVITLLEAQILLTASLKLTVTALQESWAVAVPVAVGAVFAPHGNSRSEGHVMVGFTVSRKLMLCTQLLLLPQRSVAVQVRRTVRFPVQFVAPRLSAKVIVANPLHGSVAVATPVILVVVGAVHSRVMSAGQVITGGTLSLKLMVCRQVA